MNNKNNIIFSNAEISDFEDYLKDFNITITDFMDLYAEYNALSDDSKIQILTAYAEGATKKEED